MKNSILYTLAAAALSACQLGHDDVKLDEQINTLATSEIPSKSQVFIDTYFTGEVVTDFFEVTDEKGNLTYEAFMSNNTNLVFDDHSDLFGFGNINSRMEMEDEQHDGMSGDHMNMSGSGMNGGMNGSGMIGGQNGNMMGDGTHSYRGHDEVSPEEIDPSELPAAITDYITITYPDLEILMAFAVVWSEDLVEFHVLVEQVGGLLFDQEGNFIDMIMRGNGHCESFEELAIDELSETILEYVTTKYPNDEILRARLGTHDETEEIHVMLRDAGILIFDTEGNFIEVLDRMPHHG